METETKQEQISIGTKVNQEVVCDHCQKKGNSTEFFSYAQKNKPDVYLCTDCKTLINKELEAETKDIKIGRAIGLGIIAGIIGGIAWYYISVLSGYQFGYAAIGLGYLVGFAVYFGAGKKRGHQLQIIALVITLAAIFFAEHSLFNHFVTEYVQSHLADFPDFQVGDKAGVSLFNSDFLNNLVSPIGLIIYAIGAYVAYKFPHPRKV